MSDVDTMQVIILVSESENTSYVTRFSTHTRQRCDAVVGCRAPRRSCFLCFEHELDGTVRFVFYCEVSSEAGRADDEDPYAQGGRPDSGETFLTEEKGKKWRSPFGLLGLAFRKHSLNLLKGAVWPSQRQAGAAWWRRKLLHTARMPAPEVWVCL